MMSPFFFMLVKLLLVIIALVCFLFVFLALKSQKGQPLGLVNDRLAGCGPSPNSVCSETGTAREHYIEPLSGTLSATKAAIVNTGGTITSESAKYVSATYMSRFFKFVDDVELRPDGKGVVHIRSASRVGYSDKGANRARVKAIRAAMQGAVGSPALEKG